jgi:hypothetical protein
MLRVESIFFNIKKYSDVVNMFFNRKKIKLHED